MSTPSSPTGDTASDPALHASQMRYAELDALRVIAFGLLILYHCGMFYVSWDWHVKSPRIVTALEPWMMIVNPWRMGLLFLISGAATALLLPRCGSTSAAMASRSKRLLAPLLFGMFVIVPPQAYLEVVEKLHYGGGYLEFMRLYLTAYGGFCRGDDCLAMPTWNHLWFLPYVWLYGMVWMLLTVRGTPWAAKLATWLSSRHRLLWAPWMLLAASRIALAANHPIEHNFLPDLYAHALYGSLFLIGAICWGSVDASLSARLWSTAFRLRWWALAMAIPSFAVGAWGASLPDDFPLAAWQLAALRATTAARQWLPLIAVLGFAHQRWTGKPSPMLRRLSGSIFCCYIVHQTITVVAGHVLAGWALPLPLEAALLLASTAVGCWLAYALARRLRVLHTVMGISGSRRVSTPAAPKHADDQSLS